ncbi:PilW family protein [Ureibacillus sp. MALMAid1270]|uniref:PilW family protein n=1 Tax=Ureibacillus sp. MALMAid1270 TaxID=3411629 RepID=UPI003BA7F05E
MKSLKHKWKTQSNGARCNVIMNKTLNQRGLTLMEVLAVIIITVIVGSILFNIIIQGNEQYSNQSQANREISDISYGLKVFTKDIRMATKVEFVNSNSIKSTNPAGSIDHYVYSNNTLYKNSSVYLENVAKFQISIEDTTIVVDIKLKTTHDEVSTQLVVRGE